ncbi:MAG: DUF6503 family protein [Aurantibacter sp.]
MKRILFTTAFLALFGCKEAPKEPTNQSEEVELVTQSETTDYPEALNKVFDAHGGLVNWKNKRTLSFVIAKPEAPETHTIDLHSRREKIEMSGFAMGFDGQDFWLEDEKESYKGDPIFYHNLMFYFYAMPFVLADAGINYGETAALEYEGKSFPGISISYNDGIGTSPKDEYFLHYDPETHQMTWLGYTVTYRTGEKSANVKWIRYNDWTKVGELVLPKSLTWHAYEGRTIKEAKNTYVFENVSVSETSKNDVFFGMPENAKVINKP